MFDCLITVINNDLYMVEYLIYLPKMSEVKPILYDSE